MNDQSTALVVAPQIENPITGELVLVETIFRPGGAETILSSLEQHVRSIETDIATEKGRKALRSLDLKVRKSRVALDDAGKELKDEYRKKGDAIDVERRAIRARLDALSEEIMSPLTAWEAAEAARVKEHEDALAALVEAEDYGERETSEELKHRLAFLRATPPRDWQEFSQRAERVLANEIRRTEGLLALAEKREAEAKEAERLRLEAVEAERQRLEQERVEHEARIAAEAAERARVAAEAEAARLAKIAADEAERKQRELQERADAELRAAEMRAEQQHLAEQRERQRIAAEAEAELRAAAERERKAIEAAQREREEAAAREAAQKARAEAAERQAEAARKQAAIEAAEAVERERQRVAAERARAEAEVQARESDKQHKASVNRDAMTDLIAVGLDDKSARAAVTAIAQQKVRHVRIAY